MSLLTLTLPWAGCQYVREMENTLRQGQMLALEATANAVATTLRSNHMTFDALDNARQLPEAPTLYAHPLSGPLLVDGYDSDWLSVDFKHQALNALQGVTPDGADPSPLIAATVYDERLYVWLRVYDKKIVYFNPSSDKPYDHVSLHLQSLSGQRRDLEINASAPGVAQVFNVFEKRTTRDQNRLSVKRFSQREYAIKCAWRESENPALDRSYDLEIDIPLAWATDGMYLMVHDSSVASFNHTSPGSAVSSGAGHRSDFWQIRMINPALNDALRVFAGDDLRLRYVDQSGWITANAGDLHIHSENKDVRELDLLTRLYQLILGDANLSSLTNPLATGRYQADEVHTALSGVADSRWYALRASRVGRVAVPVVVSVASVASLKDASTDKNAYLQSNEQAAHRLSDELALNREHVVLGAVVAEQTSSTVVALTNSAFGRLLFYSLASLLVAGVGFLIYASWLSYRIRRLSRQADAAIDEFGQLDLAFMASHSRDELGDLSRSYQRLLARLHQYHSYLRTLGGKLSHELRTPLAIVKSSLENMSYQEDSKQGAVYRDRALEGTERLSGILNAMSAASQLEQSIESAEIEETDMAALLTSLVHAYDDTYTHHKIVLNIEPHPQGYVSQLAPDLWVQLLDKLVENALDFSYLHKDIIIRLHRQEGTLVMEVINEGPLLPEKEGLEIFDSLVTLRSDFSITAKNDAETHHLGLGLYIVRLIARFHDAQVRGYNRADEQKVVFELRLPVKV